MSSSNERVGDNFTALGAGGSGNQGGTTGGTANALVKAASSNTLADSGLINAAGAIITPASGDAVQVCVGDFPKRLNIGGGTSGDTGLASQSGVMVCVLGDGSDFAGFKCQTFTCVGTFSGVNGVFISNTNGLFLDQSKLLGFGPAGFASLTSGFDASTAGVIKVTNGSTGGGAMGLKNISTPSPIAGVSLLYAKDVAGTSKLFAMDGAGAETQLTP